MRALRPLRSRPRSTTSWLTMRLTFVITRLEADRYNGSACDQLSARCLDSPFEGPAPFVFVNTAVTKLMAVATTKLIRKSWHTNREYAERVMPFSPQTWIDNSVARSSPDW